MKYKLLRNGAIDFFGKPRVATIARRFFIISGILGLIIIIMHPIHNYKHGGNLKKIGFNEALWPSNESRGSQNDSRSFRIDYKHDTFLLNGNPFRYVSGSIHYFRVPPEYWRDRLRKMRAGGLNAISTYVEWSFHEPKYRNYKWDGAADLVKFIQMAQEEGLLVILRPGPYICAERDMGGFPYWLLTKYPKIRLRTHDKNYLDEVSVWFDDLMGKMRPLLYGNGGPIIMVQVENEYGSFPACDHEYMAWLQSLLNSWVQNAALLFTTDTFDAASDERFCGKVAGAYITVDFGADVHVRSAFAAQRRLTGGGPLVNSEFYPGWLTHWGEPLQLRSSAMVARSLNKQLALGANVNVYMYHGGTNFGFTAGANMNDVYKSDITSYDYDAPLSEAGDPTAKYYVMKEVIAKYLPSPNISVPTPTPKATYGKIVLSRCMDLLGPTGRSHFGTNARKIFEVAPTFEALDQNSGLMLYETKLPIFSNAAESSSDTLTVRALRDMAHIFVDGVLEGVLSRTYRVSSIRLVAAQGKTLGLLVENQGRVNFGHLANDFKGILGAVTIDGIELKNWNVTQFPLDTKDFQSSPDIMDKNNVTDGILKYGPVLYKAKFLLPDGPKDTFLNTTGWGKGIVWINDYNLGRYWPSEGPQVSLYVPAVAMKPFPDVNTIYVLELLHSPNDATGNPSDIAMSFEHSPIFINSELHYYDKIEPSEPVPSGQKLVLSMDRLVIV